MAGADLHSDLTVIACLKERFNELSFFITQTGKGIVADEVDDADEYAVAVKLSSVYVYQNGKYIPITFKATNYLFK